MMTPWDVFYDGHWIDSEWMPAAMDVDAVRHELVTTHGYPAGIALRAVPGLHTTDHPYNDRGATTR